MRILILCLFLTSCAVVNIGNNEEVEVFTDG